MIGGAAGRSYAAWMRELCHSLCTHLVADEFLRLCASVCRLKLDFAEALFPHLVSDVLSGSHQARWGARLAKLLVAHIIGTAEHSEPAVCVAVHRVLELANFLRTQAAAKQMSTRGTDSKRSLPWQHSIGLDISFLDLATAAARCSSYFNALLFVELHCENARNGLLGLPDEHTAAGTSVARLLVDVFSHVDEPDSLPGLDRLVDVESDVSAYEHAGQWERAVGRYNLLLQHGHAGDPVLSDGLLRALLSQGYNHLMDLYLKVPALFRF